MQCPNQRGNSLKASSVPHYPQIWSFYGLQFVIAINKPPAISSAQVIRNLQKFFNPSTLFQPWLAAEREFRDQEQRYQRNRRKSKRIQVKIGHGGTLDPMATGVLIMGVGKGTKQLQRFLECTKTYEATVLFGAATDTYDVLGKVLKRASYGHVTKAKVETALQRFKGKIMQRPPIYSALRMQGKRLYEYAREGREIPKEIEERPVEVTELTMVEWMDGGSHEHKWPEEEAEEEAKSLAQNVLHLEESVAGAASEDTPPSTGVKRKRSDSYGDDETVSSKKPNLDAENAGPEALMSGALQTPVESSPEPMEKANSIPSSDSNIPETTLPTQGRGPPAVKLRMTVTSGFYVRSFSHDLGEAVDSLACMSALVRTRQGNFELGRNVIEYEDLHKGEEVWAPRLERSLEEWDQCQSSPSVTGTA